MRRYRYIVVPAAFLSILITVLFSPLFAVNGEGMWFTEWEIPLGGHTPGIYYGDSGEVWFTSRWSDSKIIGKLIISTNTFVEWSVETYVETPKNLIVNEDIVYFTDMGGNKIGKLLTNVDQISTKTIPTSDSQPDAITFPLGSTNTIVFTEVAGKKIGKLHLTDSTFTTFYTVPRSTATVSPTSNFVTPESMVITPTVTPGDPALPPPIAFITAEVTGDFTEYPVSPAGPFDVAADEIGYWFSTQLNYLGKLVGEDTLYTYNIPSSLTRTHGLTRDSEGNIWYTGKDSNTIGKLEPDTGTLTEWTVPILDGFPYRITVDADGMAWFTEFESNQICKLDPTTNTFYLYPIPTSISNPIDITIDPDGNIWFTETNRRIGVLSSSGVMLSTTTTTSETTEATESVTTSIETSETPTTTIITTEPSESTVTTPTTTETALVTTETTETSATTPAPSPIPGFPLSSIIAGILVATAILFFLRRNPAAKLRKKFSV